MARKKRTFSKVKAVKSAARKVVGTPPPTRREEPAVKKQDHSAPKHKLTLGELLAEE